MLPTVALIREHIMLSFTLMEMEKVISVLVFLILHKGTGKPWSVTFENPNPCALRGSSVKFGCSYCYGEGETVRRTRWYKGTFNGSIWVRVELSDLPSYKNRLEYLGDQRHDCTLEIHDLQYNDTGHYYFRFDTDIVGWRSKQSVFLSVTDLSARVHPQGVRAGENVTLECKTSCYQPPNTVWFKDGRPVTKPEFQAYAEDSGYYACAIEGEETVKSDPIVLDVQYPPLNVSIEVNHPGPLAEGSSVTLTCSSVANPATDIYTWYKRPDPPSSSSMVQVGSGQVLSLPSVNVSHTGHYSCQARNTVGVNNSTELLLTVNETVSEYQVSFVILHVGIAVKVAIVLFLPLVFIWAWKMCNVAEDKKECSFDYEDVSG